MNKYITSVSIAIILFSGLCSGDVFKHRESGEIFYGYPTNRRLGAKMRVYVEENGKFVGKSILIDDYDITYDLKGRKNNLIIIGISHQDILLSDTVSKSLAKTIIEGANKGPRGILLEIDSPGGRGDCMKIVCDAIKKTSNCPVTAFISGKKYGGVYSAAAGIALACDKIYIAPDAQIGTLCPQVDATSSMLNALSWQEMFTPDSLASFGGYLSTMAEKKNRPGAMAIALLDRNVEVVEVVIDAQGSRSIIHKAEKKPKDSIVKTWSKTITVQSLEKDPESENETSEKTESQITLSAVDALYLRMADGILSSRVDVIEALGASDAKVMSTTRIRSIVKKFAQSRVLIHRHYEVISILEKEVDEIDGELKEVISQGRKNRPTREDDRINRLRRDMYQKQTNNRGRGSRTVRNRADRKRSGNRMTNSDIAAYEAEIRDTYVNPYLLEQQRLTLELATALDDLLDNYVRVNKLARQFPGALPKGKTLLALQQQYNIALSKRDALGYY